jgi:hypothetical protein
MNIFTITIKDIKILNNQLIITSTDNTNYISIINKGNIDIKIYNSNYDEIYINQLVKNNIIKIYCKKNIIKKIIILNNYVFSNETSSEINFIN